MILVFSTQEERDKFNLLFETYKRLMLHKAYEILCDYALAEDAVSEAFIRVYKNLRKIGDPVSPQSASFLLTIVKNVSLTMLKKDRRRNTDELDEKMSSAYDLEEEVLSALSSGEIMAALDALSEELRSVFLLRYAHDLSHREIARLLGLRENTVTVRLLRAKRKLSELLAKEGLV